MKTKIFLCLVLIFFLLTRLYQIHKIPASLYWDEASISYNALSIASSLKDEWGAYLPLHFKAFGEYKLPVFIYSTAIFIEILGSQEWVIRVVSVFFSFFTLTFIYLIGKKIYPEEAQNQGLLSTFFLTISPWFFIFSRTGYETSAGVAFFCLGYLFYLYSKNNFRIQFLTVTAFILSMYSYNSFRISIPIFLIYIFIVWLKERRIRFLNLIILVLLILLSFYPILNVNIQEETRFKTVSIFSGDRNVLQISKVFIENYLSHLSPNFLILKGDTNLRSHSGFGGMVYPLDIFFFTLGTFFIIKKRYINFIPVFLILLLSFIPASITKEAPHALRSLIFVPFALLVVSFGVITFTRLIRLKIAIPVIIAIYLIFFNLYYLDFVDNYSKRSSRDWQYPYKEIFTKYLRQFDNYERIVVSDKEGQPYIFALYYLKYPQKKFQESAKYNFSDQWGYSLINGFGKFKFGIGNIEEGVKKTLIFAEPDEVKVKGKIGEVKDLSGRLIFNIYER